VKRTSRRDESLEHLLEESLQAPWQTPPSGSCPDAEVLAAWTDGALEGRELAMTREHVAGCVSCQATLAVLARTAPPEATPVPWWQRMPSVRWLVPVAATATAIVIWVAVPREEYMRPAQETTVARDATALQAESPQSAAQAKEAIAEDTANRAPQVALRSPATPPAELRLDAEEKAATGDVAERQDAAPPAREQAAVVPSEQTAETAAGALARREAAAPPAAPPPPSAQPAAPTPAQVSGFGTARRRVFSTLAVQPVLVVSPGTMLRWRIGRAGSVDYSTDAGRTWEARPTGIDADLVAGASPSGTVCWIVGRTGTVLLTINGTDWRRVTSPTTLDLTGVEATDTRTAIVTAANGQRFRTVDGGVTWQSL
jgi:hypothetical protein